MLMASERSRPFAAHACQAIQCELRGTTLLSIVGTLKPSYSNVRLGIESTAGLEQNSRREVRHCGVACREDIKDAEVFWILWLGLWHS